jgi:hypothetical protein
MSSQAYAIIRRPALRSSAVSTEARHVREAAQKVVDSGERSVALFGDRATAISQIWALAAECSESQWDGGSSEAISSGAAALASELIRALPDDVPLPEFAPEPDGSISLDWIQSRTRLFSLSVGTSDRLAYAWMDGTDRGRGVERFNREVAPPGILDVIRRIVNAGATPVGPPQRRWK